MKGVLQSHCHINVFVHYVCLYVFTLVEKNSWTQFFVPYLMQDANFMQLFFFTFRNPSKLGCKMNPAYIM